MNSPSRSVRAALALVALALAAAFVAAAVDRRLNFDELVTVRSGWLLVNHLDGLPSSPMPFNLFSGALATRVEDPGTLFLGLRLLVALGALAGLAWALRVERENAVVATSVILTLTQATFLVHGFEFRYEAAILLGLLLGFGALVRARAGDFVVLGLLVPWLAAHHVKGAFFAVAVYLMALFRARDVAGARLRLHAAAAGGAAVWLGVAMALGLVPRISAFYRMFTGLAAGFPQRWWPWESLGPAFSRDAVWWLAAAAALLSTARFLVGLAPASRRASADLWAALVSLSCLAFLLAHPHPWAYMLAPAAPFLAFLMARRFWEASAPVRAVVLLVVAAGLLFQSLVQKSGPWTVLWASFDAPRTPEVETLRVLKRLARPGEKVIDPSGLAYFLPPCTPEWYVDSLFQAAAREGRWMATLGNASPSECPWVVNTYRLDMLPKAARMLIGSEYFFLPGGLGLPKEDPRLRDPLLWEGLPPRRVENFW